ncbi:hypothetical protein GPALN_004551 [Globodera pallida]|nr:hypothetical protein GPALN_004551 [Globodera pallida]
MSGDVSHSSLSHTTASDQIFDLKDASVDFIHLEAKEERKPAPQRITGKGKNYLSPQSKILGPEQLDPNPSGSSNGLVVCSSAGPPAVSASAASVIAALKSFEGTLEAVLARQRRLEASVCALCSDGHWPPGNLSPKATEI